MVAQLCSGGLCNGRLPQQWQTTSIVVECLGNGRCPSPTELDCPGFSCAHAQKPGVFGIANLFVPLCYPKRCLPGISWARSLSKSHSVSSSALSSLRLLVQQGTQTSVLCAERCGALLHYSAGRRLHQPKPLPGILRLFYTWEFPRSVGNKDPSGNAALTHPLRIHRELQSWVVLTVPS